MRQIQFWTTTIISPVAVFLAGISQNVLISPAFSQTAPLYPNDPASGYIRPEFENPDSVQIGNSPQNSTSPVQLRQSEQAERLPEQFNLRGKWLFRFEGDMRPPSTMEITQSSDRFVINAEYGEITQMHGTISGEQIVIDRIVLSPNNPDTTGDAIYGTVSTDGNRINGELRDKSDQIIPVVMQRVSGTAPQ